MQFVSAAFDMARASVAGVRLEVALALSLATLLLLGAIVAIVRRQQARLAQAAAELVNVRAGARKLLETFNAVSVPIIELDGDDRPVFANHAATRTFGSATIGSVDVATLLLLPHEWASLLRACLADARSDGSSAVSLPLACGGSTKTYEFRVAVTSREHSQEHNEKLPHVVLWLMAASEGGTEMQAVLASRHFDLFGRIASGIAHDLNNRLCVIRSAAELAALELPSDQRAISDVGAINAAAGEAIQLTSDLVGMSRPAPRPDGPTSVNATLLRLTKALVRVVGRDRQLIIDVPDLPLLTALSPSELQELILQLVANAADACSRHGKIWVGVSQSSAGAVRLTVTDDGSGITNDLFEKVFDPFFTTKDSSYHLGLGLSQVRAVLARAGGEIQIESSPGIKTEVCVHLPPAETVHMESTNPTVTDDSTAPRLLILEDEEAVRRLLVRLLGRDGYRIAESSTLSEALDQARAISRLDVWVTDANVDGVDAMTGISAMRQMHPGLAIVLISGAEPDPDQMQILESEGVCFLAKPFAPAALRAVIDEACEKRSTTSVVVPLTSETVRPEERKAR